MATIKHPLVLESSHVRLKSPFLNMTQHSAPRFTTQDCVLPNIPLYSHAIGVPPSSGTIESSSAMNQNVASEVTKEAVLRDTCERAKSHQHDDDVDDDEEDEDDDLVTSNMSSLTECTIASPRFVLLFFCASFVSIFESL